MKMSCRNTISTPIKNKPFSVGEQRPLLSATLFSLRPATGHYFLDSRMSINFKPVSRLQTAFPEETKSQICKVNDLHSRANKVSCIAAGPPNDIVENPDDRNGRPDRVPPQVDNPVNSHQAK
jgi:hypothetical protein